jgi:hypothetical protein
MKAIARQLEQQSGLNVWQLAVVFLLACAVLVSRSPDAVFHAQFWAEDGHVWFADAYNLGWWHALFRTQDGYFQVFPRLAASLALLVSLARVPLVLNLVAIVMQAIPALLLLSSRSSVLGSLRFRAFLAAIYLVLPNCREICAVLTNSQWVLALCAFLLLAASTPRSILGKLFDVSILLLCGLTGPFCVFLLPVALFLAWKRRERWQAGPIGVLFACCLTQAWGLLIVNPSGRSHYAHTLGASPTLFVRLLAGQVYLGALLGGNSLATGLGHGLLVFFICVAIGGSAFVLFCFFKSPDAMKLFLIFSFALFAVSLLSPNTGSPTGSSAWNLLTYGSGVRYWFFPTLAFAWSLVYCADRGGDFLKLVARCVLVLMCIGVARDWRRPAFPDVNYAASVRNFEAAPSGAKITIPLNPKGWEMELVKHEP